MSFLSKRLHSFPRGTGIASIRAYLLEGVIRLFLVLGFFAVLMGGYEMWAQGRWPVAGAYIAAYLPVAACCVWGRRLPYGPKAIIILMALFALSVWILADIGLSGAGLHLLTTFIVLTTSLMGIRAGLLALALSIAAILGVGFGMSYGLLAIDLSVMANSVRMEAWLTAATLFLIIGGIMVLLPGILQNSLQASMDAVREKTEALRTSNLELTRVLEERKALEERLIKAEQFKAIGQLAGGVAHDLNNILVGVTTYPELILEGLPEDSELRDPLSTVKASGDKAAAVVRDLLTLARQGAVAKQDVDLNQVIRACIAGPAIERLKRLYPGLSVSARLAPSLPQVLGSAAHLSDTVMNLVSDSAGAMAGIGEISITTCERCLTAPLQGYETIPAGRYSTVEMTDQRPVVTPEDLKRIFEPFSSRTRTNSTGLGMAIVFSAVKGHQGFIDVIIRHAGGARFTLYFPAGDLPSPSRQTSPADGAPPRGFGKTVLLVDDVREQREVGEKVLTRLGYRPVCLDSGEAAVTWCRANRPDIALLDMVMDPGMNGYETLVRLRQALPELPVVLFSGFSETGPVEAALKLDRTRFLKKPYTLLELALTLKELT